LVTAESAAGKVGGRQHEEPADGVDIACFAASQCGVVGGEDLGAPRGIDGETSGMGLAQRPVGPGLGGHKIPAYEGARGLWL